MNHDCLVTSALRQVSAQPLVAVSFSGHYYCNHIIMIPWSRSVFGMQQSMPDVRCQMNVRWWTKIHQWSITQSRAAGQERDKENKSPHFYQLSIWIRVVNVTDRKYWLTGFLSLFLWWVCTPHSLMSQQRRYLSPAKVLHNLKMLAKWFCKKRLPWKYTTAVPVIHISSHKVSFW